MSQRNVAVTAACLALAGSAAHAGESEGGPGPELGSPGMPVIEVHQGDPADSRRSSGSGLLPTPGYAGMPAPPVDSGAWAPVSEYPSAGAGEAGMGQGSMIEDSSMGGFVPGMPMGYPPGAMWGQGGMPGQPAPGFGDMPPDQDVPGTGAAAGWPPGGTWTQGYQGRPAGEMPPPDQDRPAAPGQDLMTAYPPGGGWGPGSIPGAPGYGSGGTPGGDYGYPGKPGQEQGMGYPPRAAWGPPPMPGEYAAGSAELPGGDYDYSYSYSHSYGDEVSGQRQGMGYPPGGMWGRGSGWGPGADEGRMTGYPPAGAWGQGPGSGESWSGEEAPMMDYPGTMNPYRGMQGFGPMAAMMGAPMRFMEERQRAMDERHRAMDERMDRIESLLQQILTNQERLLSER